MLCKCSGKYIDIYFKLKITFFKHFILYIPIYAMAFIEEKVQFWEKRPPPIKNSGYGPVRHPIPEGLVVDLIVLGRFSPPFFSDDFTDFRTFDFVAYGPTILLLWLRAWACTPLVSLCSVCLPFV